MLFGAGKNPDWDMPLNGIAHWSEEAERRLKTGDDWWYKPQLPPTQPLTPRNIPWHTTASRSQSD